MSSLHSSRTILLKHRTFIAFSPGSAAPAQTVQILSSYNATICISAYLTCTLRLPTLEFHYTEMYAIFESKIEHSHLCTRPSHVSSTDHDAPLSSCYLTMAPIRPPNDWAFNLRSALPYYDTDDSDDELPQASISEEAQLKIDLDLSSRQETVEYKPNPWNIAKINAASRSSASRPPEKTGKDEDESSMINEPRKLKAPKGQIVDAFKKQAERRLSVSAGVNGRVLVPGPHVSILPPVDPKPGTVRKKARVSSTAADHSEARHIGHISTRLLAIPSSSSARHHPALNNTKHQIQMNICASDSAFVSRGLNSPKPISNSVPRSKLNFKSFSSPVQTPALISAAHFPPNGGHANKRPLQGYFPLSSPVRPTYGVSASAFTSAASKNDFAFLPQSDLDPNPDVLVPQQEPEQPQSYFRSNPASSSRTCADGTGDHGDALYMQLFDGARGGIPTNLSYDDAHEKDGGNLQGLGTFDRSLGPFVNSCF